MEKVELAMHSFSVADRIHDLDIQWRLSADDDHSFIKNKQKPPSTKLFPFQLIDDTNLFVFSDYYYLGENHMSSSLVDCI